MIQKKGKEVKRPTKMKMLLIGELWRFTVVTART